MEKGKRFGGIRLHINNCTYTKKQVGLPEEMKQNRQVVQTIHEFVINNCIKCFYICFMAFGSKCMK